MAVASVESLDVRVLVRLPGRALRRDGQADRAAEWTRVAMAQKSYDAVLALMYDFIIPT